MALPQPSSISSSRIPVDRESVSSSSELCVVAVIESIGGGKLICKDGTFRSSSRQLLFSPSMIWRAAEISTTLIGLLMLPPFETIIVLLLVLHIIAERIARVLFYSNCFENKQSKLKLWEDNEDTLPCVFSCYNTTTDSDSGTWCFTVIDWFCVDNASLFSSSSFLIVHPRSSYVENGGHKYPRTSYSTSQSACRKHSFNESESVDVVHYSKNQNAKAPPLLLTKFKVFRVLLRGSSCYL